MIRHCERSEAIREAAGDLHHGKWPERDAYAGVTSNLVQRVSQHREGYVDGFTRRYGCKDLVWFEMAETMEAAIVREKQIKGGSRTKKLALIEAHNAEWRDLFGGIV